MNQIAAREIRVKLSELCYKSIACDGTEDKKHIDLSSEPMILVCAAGLSGSTADDVSKEVAIFRAHKAAPIVIASESDRSFPAALAVLTVPDTHQRLAFVLATIAGHLFGYEAALAIDAQAQPLREAHAAIDAPRLGSGGDLHGEHVDGEQLLAAAARPYPPSMPSLFLDGMRSGAYNGHLEANTAVRLAGQLRYAVGVSTLDAYQVEFGKVGTPGVVLEDLSAGLTSAIEELTRPVDAIKHQAKTVTVGISRSDESLLQVAAGGCGARGRFATGSTHLLDAAVARRARSGVIEVTGSHPLPGRARRRSGSRDGHGGGPGRRVGRPALAGRPGSAAARHQGPGRT